MHQPVAAMWLVHQSVTLNWPLPRARMEDTAEAHAAILRACGAGDVEAYAAAVDAHYEPLSHHRRPLMHSRGAPDDDNARRGTSPSSSPPNTTPPIGHALLEDH